MAFEALVSMLPIVCNAVGLTRPLPVAIITLIAGAIVTAYQASESGKSWTEAVWRYLLTEGTALLGGTAGSYLAVLIVYGMLAAFGLSLTGLGPALLAAIASGMAFPFASWGTRAIVSLLRAEPKISELRDDDWVMITSSASAHLEIPPPIASPPPSPIRAAMLRLKSWWAKI